MSWRVGNLRFVRPLVTVGDRLCPCGTVAARTQRGPSSTGYAVGRAADGAEPDQGHNTLVLPYGSSCVVSCGAGLLVVVAESVEKLVEVSVGVAPVERGGGLLIAVLEGQQLVLDLDEVGEVVG
jgi:hypothetical protein